MHFYKSQTMSLARTVTHMSFSVSESVLIYLPCVWVAPPTCRSWISVKVITLTRQQRLMAPRAAASPDTGAAALLQKSKSTMYHWVRGRRRGRRLLRPPSWVFAEIFGRQGMTHQLIWEPHRPFPDSLYVFSQGKAWHWQKYRWQLEETECERVGG